MAEEKQEKERRVSTDDVLKVLTKHSAVPNDPDDAETLRLYNEQQSEQPTEQEQEADTGEKGAKDKQHPTPSGPRSGGPSASTAGKGGSGKEGGS
jgi:hypothetical protein